MRSVGMPRDKSYWIHRRRRIWLPVADGFVPIREIDSGTITLTGTGAAGTRPPLPAVEDSGTHASGVLREHAGARVPSSTVWFRLPANDRAWSYRPCQSSSRNSSRYRTEHHRVALRNSCPFFGRKREDYCPSLTCGGITARLISCEPMRSTSISP